MPQAAYVRNGWLTRTIMMPALTTYSNWKRPLEDVTERVLPYKSFLALL